MKGNHPEIASSNSSFRLIFNHLDAFDEKLIRKILEEEFYSTPILTITISN